MHGNVPPGGRSISLTLLARDAVDRGSCGAMRAAEARARRPGSSLTGGGARAAYQVGVLSALARAKAIAAPTRPIRSTSSPARRPARSTPRPACGSDDFDGVVDQLRAWENFSAEQVYHADAPASSARARWLTMPSIGWAIGAGARAAVAARQHALGGPAAADGARRAVAADDGRGPSAGARDHRVELRLKGTRHLLRRAGRHPAVDALAAHRSAREAIGGTTCSPRRRSVRLSGREPRTERAGRSTSATARCATGADLAGGAPGRRAHPRHRRRAHARAAAVARWSDGYPSLAQIAGHAMSSIFLDALAFDIERLQRISQRDAGLLPPAARSATSLPRSMSRDRADAAPSTTSPRAIWRACRRLCAMLRGGRSVGPDVEARGSALPATFARRRSRASRSNWMGWREATRSPGFFGWDRRAAQRVRRRPDLDNRHSEQNLSAGTGAALRFDGGRARLGRPLRATRRRKRHFARRKDTVSLVHSGEMHGRGVGRLRDQSRRV